MKNKAECKAMESKIRNVEELEEQLSRPSEELVEMFRRLEGDILFLGVNGKIGRSLARMARRATEASGVERRIIGLARFKTEADWQTLENEGIETITGDLLDQDFVSSLPKVENVVFLAGMKFGAQENISLTWAINVYVPAMVARHFSSSRIIAYSTGCVYPLVPVSSGGSVESDPALPVGEYAQSTLGRERMFEFGAVKYGNPVVLIRLNYAVEMRYGVLLDIGLKVKNDSPVDLTMGYFNVIWQGDANRQVLLSLEHCLSPANILNITGPEVLSVREVAEIFGRIFAKDPVFVGKEAETALLNNAEKSLDLFGKPEVSVDQIISWLADWISEDGEMLNKPTHFEVRDGQY